MIFSQSIYIVTSRYSRVFRFILLQWAISIIIASFYILFLIVLDLMNDKDRIE